MITCRRCGKENADDARFCNACGLPLASAPAREERKVVTVLFADLVGFTARAEQMDPEDVRALQDPYWQHLRAEIERHGGTVEKFIGDAVVALFGAPLAHEDDPERAVRAALAIREWASEQQGLEVRIGIATGEALVRLGAEPLAGEGMASGDVVNTASRIQAAAPANGILVGESTFRATRRVIGYREVKPAAAKGKAEPILLWEAIEARSRLGVDIAPHAATPLVGRKRELELLRSALGRVRAERSPQLVTIVGVPGIGKSRLVLELMQALEAEQELVTWRQGRSLPYGEGVSYWALAEIVKAQAGILETDDGGRAQEKLTHTTHELLGAGVEAAWADQHLRPLVGLSSEAEIGTDRRSEKFAAWRRFFEALADERPLVLVFEDLHWADTGLLDFLDHLVEWASSFPILVVGTARPELIERRSDWAGGKLNATTLSLPPLAPADAAQLIETLLGQRALEVSLEALVEHAGGNPLFAEQVARMVLEGGEDEELPFAETVQAIIAARLDLLPPDEKRLLQDAAVVGKVFWLGSLVDGRSRDAVEERLHVLERKGFIARARRSSVAAEPEYAFSHILLRDVSYGQIPRADRFDKHVRTAEWIESLGRREEHAETLAHHYAAALELGRVVGRPLEPLITSARRALRDAGDRAFALNAYAQAARFYGDTLAIWPPGDAVRPQVLFRYAAALHVTGDAEQEQALLDAHDALLQSGEPEAAAEAEALLAEMYMYRGVGERMDEHLDNAIALIREATPSERKAQVLATVSRLRMLKGQYDEAIGVGQQARDLAGALGLNDIRADVNVTLGTARWLSGDHGGAADIEQGLESALASNDLRTASRAYNNLGIVKGDELDFPGQVEMLERAARISERLGDRESLRYYRGSLIGAKLSQGEWDEALRLADTFIAECGLGQPHLQERIVRMVRCRIRLARDDTDGALADYESALALAHKSKNKGDLLDMLAFGTRIHGELGRRGDAQALGDALLSHLADFDSHDAFHDLAWSASRVGRARELRAKLDTLPSRSSFRMIAEDILAGEFERVATALSRTSHEMDEAEAWLRAADKNVEQGRHEEANQQLEKALAFYRSVGATRYIRQAEALLSTTGSTVRE